MNLWRIGFLVSLVVLFVVPTSNAAAAPSTGNPMILLSPSTELADGEVVTVTGSGFSGSPFELELSECAIGSNASCGSDSKFVSVGATGTFSVGFTVDRSLISQTIDGFTSVDCATGGCLLRAQDLKNGQSTEVPLAFAAHSPARVTLDVDPTAQVDRTTGDVTVNGSVRCHTTVDIELTGTISQPQPPLVYQQPLFADPSHRQRILCHARPVSWTSRVSPWPGHFAQGGAAGDFAVGQASVSVEASQTKSNEPISVTSSHVHVVGIRGRPPIYYLALGESLAHGYAAPPGQGYTNDLLAHLQTKIPNLQLVELSCNDETTTQAIVGDSCNYGTSATGTHLTQLQAAEAFLEAHQDSVDLITIDLGGVDLIRCSTPTCVSQVEPTLAANLKTIINGLRRDARTVPIVGDNYYDPVLSEWFESPSDRAYAVASVPGLRAFNDFLVAAYTGLAVQSADIQAAFKTADMTPVASKWGTIPKDLYMMCRYTDIPCPHALLDVDANRLGYRIFAKAFEMVTDPLLFTRDHRG